LLVFAFFVLLQQKKQQQNITKNNGVQHRIYFNMIVLLKYIEIFK